MRFGKRMAALLLTLSILFAAVVPSSAASFFYGDSPMDLRMGGLQEFILEVQEYYKDEVSLDTLFNGIYKGMFEALEDPWSVYFSYEDGGREIYTTVDEEYVGIGISCRPLSDGELLIVALVEDGPAEKAGLKTGDLIMKINNQNVTELEPGDAVNLLRGPQGTSVTVTVERGEETLIFTVTRDMIVNRETVSGRMLDGSIGYIRIDSFDIGTAASFSEKLSELQLLGARGMILDLRGCPGGFLQEAVDTADRLISQGGLPISTYVRKGEIIDTKTSTYSAAYKLPTVVLINGETASASELLTAALRENGVAYVIGEPSYGKGVAQIFEDTVQHHAYRLSIYYFRTPLGHDIDGQGIIPDQTVKNAAGLSAAEKESINSVLAPMTEAKKYRSGESGLNVYGAQQRLRTLGYDVALTSVMDSKTVAAVKEIQTLIGGYPYACLDYGTMEGLERLFQEYVNGSGEDLQLERAVEYLAGRIGSSD